MGSQNSSARFTHYPLLWLAVCFAFGIVVAEYYPSRTGGLIAACGLTAIAAAIFISRNFSLVFLSIAFAAAGSISLQLEKDGVGENRLKRIYDEGRIASGEPVEIEGFALGKPEPAFDGFFLRLRVEKITHNGSTQNASGSMRLFAPVQSESVDSEYDQLGLHYGSRILVACNPEREDRYLNPGVISRKEQLDQQGLDATATIKSPLLIEKLDAEEIFHPLSFVYEQRQNLISEFRDKFSVSTAGILSASLLGDKYFLDKQSADVFREGGTFHILVISGLHITFIGGLTVLLVRLFTRKKLWQFLIASTFLWAYTLAVGAEVPVVRASLMFTILLFSRVIYRKGTLLNALGGCALILLVWRPQDIFTPSFQLTMVSIAAIVAMAFPLIEKLRSVGAWVPTSQNPFPPHVSDWLKRFCETLYWREITWTIEGQRQIWSASLFKSPYLKILETRGLQGLAAFVFEGILVSVVVQLWLLPFLVIYFHRISVVAIILNLWVGVFIALESFSALIAVAFSSISDSLALPVIKLTEALNWLLIFIPQLFVDNDWASYRLPVYSGPMRMVYFLYLIPVVIIGYAAYSWDPFAFGSKTKQGKFSRKIVSTAGAFAAVFAIIIAFHPYSAPRADGRLRVDFLDVGHGDSAFITFPNGQTMLVDGGGRINFQNRETENDGESAAFEPDIPRIGESVVSEYLWEKGYSKVDYLLATHSHTDHMQGLVDVARNFDLDGFFLAQTPVNNVDLKEISTILRKRGIEFTRIGRGDTFVIGGVGIEVIHPSPSDTPSQISDNNNSIVLLVALGERRFLLTADIERELEEELLKSTESVKADIVKVAHHGSRTSSTQAFVDASNAYFAIISVGRSSMFGHPHSEVVERWKLAGARVMTTGERGTISISTDGNDLEIKTFVP